MVAFFIFNVMVKLIDSRFNLINLIMLKKITPLRAFIVLNIIEFFSLGWLFAYIAFSEQSCFIYRLYIQVIYRPYFFSPLVLLITLFFTGIHDLGLLWIKKKYSLDIQPLLKVLWISIPFFLSLTGCIHEPYVNNCEIIE